MKPKIKTTCTKLQLQLLSFCLLCLSGKTRCDGNGPAFVTVEQGSDAVLPCSLSSKENIELYLFDWKKAAQIDGGQKEVFYYYAGVTYDIGRAGQSEEFKGRVAHFPEELKHGNASIIIRNTTVADSGDYTCNFPDLQPPQTFHIELVVAKKPFITTLEETKDWSRLQCEVQDASPKPKVEWKDSSGNILPAEKTQVTVRGGSYDIILQTTVTKTDYYHCVVTQGENHQIEAKIHVYISGAAPKPNIRTLDETDNWALLQCEANGHPQPEVEWRDSAGNKLPAQKPQVSERDGRFYVTLNTTVTKTDRYRCVATQKTISHQIHDETFVRFNGPAVVTVEQDSAAVLPCSLSPKEDIESYLFDWKKPAQIDGGQKKVFYYYAGVTYDSGRAGQSEEFKGRVAHFPEELKHGNASIIIRNTKLADSGNYTCVFANLQPPQTFHIKLVVDRVLKDRTDENIPGAAPKPNIRTLDQTNNRALLQCEVHGNPQPEVEWRDSAGNTLPAEEPQVSERDGRFYVTLNTAVTKTDRYRCVATQKDISHQIYAETFVHITGAAPKPNIRTLDQTDYWVLLQCEANGNPQPQVEWRDSAGNKLPAEEPQFTERDGLFYVTLNTAVTKTDRYHCVATQKDISHQIHDETFVRFNGSSTGKTVAGVICTLLVVIGVALACWCYKKKKTHNKGSPADENAGSAVPLKSQPSQSQEAPDPET